MWWLATVIVVATYTANLASLLTATRSQKSIDSVEDLAGQSKVKYGKNFINLQRLAIMVSARWHKMFRMCIVAANYENDTSFGNRLVMGSAECKGYTPEFIPQFIHNKPAFHNCHIIVRWCW